MVGPDSNRSCHNHAGSGMFPNVTYPSTTMKCQPSVPPQEIATVAKVLALQTLTLCAPCLILTKQRDVTAGAEAISMLTKPSISRNLMLDPVIFAGAVLSSPNTGRPDAVGRCEREVGDKKIYHPKA